jgi:hypothetical protein
MQLRMVLEGAEALEANLRALPIHLARNALKRALLTAAAPMVTAAQAGMNSRFKGYVVASPNLTRRQAAQARKPERVGGQAVEVFVYVGVRPKRHLHLIEFGSGPRYTKTGAYRGVMPADPYMRPGFDTTHTVVLAEFGRIIGREIEAAATRLARRTGKAASAEALASAISRGYGQNV